MEFGVKLFYHGEPSSEGSELFFPPLPFVPRRRANVRSDIDCVREPEDMRPLDGDSDRVSVKESKQCNQLHVG